MVSLLEHPEKYSSGVLTQLLPNSTLKPQVLNLQSTSIGSPVKEETVETPPQSSSFTDVFGPQRATRLPPHLP